MSSKKMTVSARDVPPVELNPNLKPAHSATLFVEDGWIFSQQPGKGVECLRRIDETTISEIHPGN